MVRIAALLVVIPGSARADGLYVTEGAGGTNVHNDLGTYIDSAIRPRISIGMRRHTWALEAWLGAAIDNGMSYAQRSTPGADPYTSGPTNLGLYGVDFKSIHTLSPHLEVYLRGTMSHADADGALAGYAGRGLGFGAGAQVKGKVSVLGLLFWPLFFVPVGPKLTGALWVDTGYEFYRLNGSRQTVDAELSSITLGLALGSDF